MPKKTAVMQAALGLAGLGLSGCAAAHTGTAAVIGDTKINEDVIGSQLNAINTVLGIPADSPSSVASLGLVTRNVQTELVNQLADSLDVTVPGSEVSEATNLAIQQAGGPELFEQQAAQSLVPPDEIETVLQASLLLAAIGETLAPGASPAEQQQAALQALSDYGLEVGVEIAPKYGEWSPQQLQPQAPTDPVSEPGEPPAAQNLLPQQ